MAACYGDALQVKIRLVESSNENDRNTDSGVLPTQQGEQNQDAVILYLRTLLSYTC